MADRLDILDLYARQSHAIDGGDATGWSETFTEDGVFESPTYEFTAVGRLALRDFAEQSNSAALSRGEQLRHWMDAVIMLAADPDTVNVHAYLMILATSQRETRIDRSVRVIDKLAKRDGAWLVHSRQVVRDG